MQIDKERFESRKETIGLWKGFDYTPPWGWATTSLDGLLEAVSEQVPHFDRAPAVVRLRRETQALLLKLRLSHAQVRELLAFEGKQHELVPILDQLIRRFGENPLTLALRHRLLELRSARMRAKLDLFKQGVLGFAPAIAFDEHNKVLNSYLDGLQARNRGTQTANQTLQIKTAEVGAGYATPAGGDVALGHLLGVGKVPGEIDVQGYQTTWITHFLLGDNNGATTTVAAVTSPTQFQLTLGTGFQQGDRIEVQSSLGSIKTTITALTGGVNATVNTPVPGIAITNPVIQIWGESGLKGNADGTTLFTHSQFSDGGYTKTLHKSILVESAIIERSVGV